MSETNEELLLQSLQDGLSEMQLALPDGSAEKLIAYINLLSKWNKTHNLTAVKNPAEMVRRHLLDSLSMVAFIGRENLLDVGAGAGLPGIPLAIAKPHVAVTLVDSVLKKTRFMSFAANDLGLANVQVKHQRVEAMEREPGYQLVIARAFSSVDKLCLLTKHLLTDNGRILAMMGHPLSDEQIIGLPDICGFFVVKTEKLFVPGEHAERNIVVLQRSAD